MNPAPSVEAVNKSITASAMMLVGKPAPPVMREPAMQQVIGGYQVATKFDPETRRYWFKRLILTNEGWAEIEATIG